MINIFKQHFLPSMSAILLILLGIAASMIAITYDVGSFTRMGPGFIPLVLSILVSLIGGLILFGERGKIIQLLPLHWRPILFVAAGILAWVILAETAGFFIASATQVILCSLALPAPKWRSTLIFTTLLTIAGYIIFVLQLGVPLNAFG